ncbi:uncharacterized protein PF3D7_1120600-like [Polyergus mexicanus]|uniref:uncharacterized protein PF3D7_1120600-like n=1 Tax=Polyergus mexicanus TaxID=615972 RepID=UPI0038B570F3
MVKIEKIKGSKINSDINLRNIDSEEPDDHMDKKNKKIKLHDTLQDKSSSKMYISQNNCEDRNMDNRNETTIETKMKDKSNIRLDIILQKNKSKNNNELCNSHEIKRKSKLQSYDNEQNELGDTDHPFLLAAFNRAFYKNLPNNKNSNEDLICNNKENNAKIITIKPEMCRYESQSDLLNLSIFDEESILKQIENNEKKGNYLLNYSDINNISFIMDESILLNNTYTIENFPEIENTINKLENIQQTEDKLEEEQNTENIKDDNNLDRDYEPSEDSTSDTDYESNDGELSNEHINENETNTSNNLRRSTLLNLSSTANAPGTSGCDDAQLTIDNSCSGIKKYYCLFCKLPKSKIARHLENVHRNEEDVKKFAQLPKGCLERKRIIETIRRQGEFQLNTDKMLNDGKLHVVRRPNIKFNKKASEYGVCIKCYGFFSKNTLRNHTRKCVNLKYPKNRTITVLGRTILGRINEIVSQTLKKMIFPVLREDSITRLIRYDELIIRYGNKLCMKYKPQHQHDMVRNRLRTLGRSLQALKNINNEITDFASLYQPKYYDDCIKAVYQVARYNPETQKFGAASTAFQLETRAHITRQKVEIAPSINDIKKLYNYVNTKRCEAYKILKEKFSYNVWQALGECTLISMQIYNRKRAGEIQRILLEDFYTYEDLNEQSDPDLFKSLSAKEIARFNKQRFKFLRACDQMRKFAYECGADHPERLRGTLLRKHIATNCHKLKLTEHEVYELANFMGHQENIYKKYYRLPQKEADILNISKYLEAALGTNNSNSDIDSSDIDDSNTHDHDNDSISYNNSDISLNDTNADDDLANNNLDNNNTQESSYLLINNNLAPKRKKSQRLCNTNETVQCESASITRSWDSAKKYKGSSQISNLSSYSSSLQVDHLKRLTREIVTIKYDMRQALSLLDILVERTNKSTEYANTKFSFGDAENRFPLQTVAQLAEVEEILKVSD